MQLMNRRGRRREKVFGEGRSVPLDRNAKARIWTYALAYTARHRQPGQHRGPLTRAFLDVLRSLLWNFHNAATGRCFPSYERIAEAARVNRATVARAIEALEAADVMTWENRLIRQRVPVEGLLGRSLILVPRRTSNAYRFRDPQPPALPLFPKSQNSTGTRIQDFSKPLIAEEITLDPANKLDAALLKLKTAMTEHPIG
jgi:hypothetical protein